MTKARAGLSLVSVVLLLWTIQGFLQPLQWLVKRRRWGMLAWKTIFEVRCGVGAKSSTSDGSNGDG